MAMVQEHKLGYPKFHVPMEKQFYKIFYSSIEQRKVKASLKPIVGYTREVDTPKWGGGSLLAQDVI